MRTNGKWLKSSVATLVVLLTGSFIQPVVANADSNDYFVGQINYDPNYSVRVYSIDDNNNVKATDTYLKGQTLWKVYNSKDVNGVKYDNVGGNQWVEANYINAFEPTSFTGEVNYTPGYSIRVYSISGNALTETPTMLANGTTWQVYGSQTLNGVKYYKVGGNQWVQAQFIKTYVPAPAWDGQSLLTVGYRSGYGISVRQGPSTDYNTVPGLYLKTGTSWKVLDQKQVNGKTWYQVGKDQWVSSDYVVFGKVNQSSIKLNVPYISQYTPVFAPWGCASSAMAMLVGYEGTKVDLKYAQDNLPMYPEYAGGQVGNVYTGAGFGHVIIPQTLADYASRWNSNVRDVDGSNIETIKNLVLSGHPVLYYGYSSYQNLSENTYRNHCKVIVGYDNGNFLIHDPLYGSASKGAGTGGTKSLGYNNGYDNGAIYWSNMSKFAYEYNGGAITIK